MSRRRGEFEHRTSIFEGAFRAWSHLGGLDPEELESKSAAELDPLTNPIVNDPRLSSRSDSPNNPDGSKRREYPYEPLPRSGLAHPYVQAILSPWLGPDADNEAIQLGLTTLRTWWQHRRKGESGSAIAALGTEKMKGVVEGYTRHFFTLAHCLVVSDKVQPPRGLHAKMKELEKQRNKRNKKRGRDEVSQGPDVGPHAVTAIRAELENPNLTPLEKLHMAQQRQMEINKGITSGLPSMNNNNNNNNGGPMIDMKNKCVPGKIDLPGVVNAVELRATQMAHRGGGVMPSEVVSSGGGMINQLSEFGDPNTTPVVFVNKNGDIQIAMKVDGITCAHCVKIVETVLRGCNGNKSPINGLLDAAADRDLSSVIIKIDRASNAKRIAFEAKRNLSMVGYTAHPKEMSIVGQGADAKSTMNLGALSTAFEVVANTNTEDVFDWNIPCTCPDNGVLRGDCSRHSQMNTRIFDAFNRREQQVKEFMAGCGMKYGMECTCGPNCRCKNCRTHQNNQNNDNQEMSTSNDTNMDMIQNTFNETPIHVEQSLNFNNFEMGPPAPVERHHIEPISVVQTHARRPAPVPHFDSSAYASASGHQNGERVIRNPSILSFGGNGLRSSITGPRGSIRGSLRNSLRGMSITSETTFGRAMSGLSALSIDWENLDDFDVEEDHSAHVNNGPNNTGPRRGSVRRSMLANGGSSEPHVSFKV